MNETLSVTIIRQTMRLQPETGTAKVNINNCLNPIYILNKQLVSIVHTYNITLTNIFNMVSILTALLISITVLIISNARRRKSHINTGTVVVTNSSI